MNQNDVKQFLLAECESITSRAKDGGRRLTDAEHATVTAYLARVHEIKDNARITERMENMRATGSGGAGVKTADTVDGMGAQLVRAGFNLKHNPSVEVSAFDALAKAPTLPATTVISPTGPTVVASGQDERYLWRNLLTENAEGATSVSDFRQTARSVTGSVERAIDATTDKAEVNVTLQHVVEAMRQVAVTISDIPNALLDVDDLLRQFFDAEARFIVEQAMDAHCMAQIVAAAPPFGTTGAGLVAQVRNGITNMRSEGASPDLLVVNATDAAALDLTTDAGGYVFPLRDTGSSPLWNLRVVERPGTTPPYIVDSRMLGRLYLGRMSFDADPYTGFKKNLTTLRVETNALFHVRDPRGARRIAAA